MIGRVKTALFKVTVEYRECEYTSADIRNGINGIRIMDVDGLTVFAKSDRYDDLLTSTGFRLTVTPTDEEYPLAVDEFIIHIVSGSETARPTVAETFDGIDVAAGRIDGRFIARLAVSHAAPIMARLAHDAVAHLLTGDSSIEELHDAHRRLRRLQAILDDRAFTGLRPHISRRQWDAGMRRLEHENAVRGERMQSVASQDKNRLQFIVVLLTVISAIGVVWDIVHADDVGSPVWLCELAGLMLIGGGVMVFAWMYLNRHARL